MHCAEWKWHFIKKSFFCCEALSKSYDIQLYIEHQALLELFHYLHNCEPYHAKSITHTMSLLIS